jgi:hypothetical protein
MGPYSGISYQNSYINEVAADTNTPVRLAGSRQNREGMTSKIENRRLIYPNKGLNAGVSQSHPERLKLYWWEHPGKRY